MFSRKRRFVILGAMAVVALAVGVVGPANAVWESGSCGAGNQLGTNPTTSNPLRVSVQPQLFWGPNQLMWLWVCVDDGGTTANSVGTAGYYWANTTGAGYGQHIVNCVGSTCSDAFVGATVGGVAAGPNGGGAQARVTAQPVRTDCEDVRATATPTPGPTSPVNVATGNPSGGGFCGISVNGMCTGREVVVTAGGTTATIDVTGTVPITHAETVATVSVCVNRYGLVTNPVAVTTGPTC